MTAKENRHLYNGKELQTDLNLNWYDYGARMYQPDIGRWNHIDGLADEYHSWSPYNYALNRPNVNVDYDGFAVTDPIKNLKVPNNPNEVDPQIWKRNPNHKAPGSMQWIDKNGNKLTFDKGVSGAQGWDGKDHWHYEDANKNRYMSNGKIASRYSAGTTHLEPGTETQIQLNKRPNSMVKKNKFGGGSKGSLGKAGTALGWAGLAVDLISSFTGDPHSIGMRFMEGYSDNTLYYSEENNNYWERRDSKDITNEDGEVVGKEYYIDVYTEYSYDEEKGRYVGTGEKQTVKGEQYEGQAAREYLLQFH